MWNLQALRVLSERDRLMQNQKPHNLAQLSNNKFDHTSWAPLVLTYQHEKLQPLTVSIAMITKYYPSKKTLSPTSTHP